MGVVLVGPGWESRRSCHFLHFCHDSEMGVSTSIIVKTFPSRLVPTLIATDLTSTRVMHERYGVFSSDGFDVGHDQEVAFPGPCNIALKAYSRIKVHGILEIGTRPSSDGGRTWVHSQVAGRERMGRNRCMVKVPPFGLRTP